MAHAVMRVIGMIARKRRTCSDDSQKSGYEDDSSEPFADACLTLLEKRMYSKSSIAPGGYLCLDLELYVTHEPCVMCCMALLHSRFGKVVFGEQMPDTGGLVAENVYHGQVRVSRYGLFWRPSLNWKFLAWQWRKEGEDKTDANKEMTYA